MRLSVRAIRRAPGLVGQGPAIAGQCDVAHPRFLRRPISDHVEIATAVETAKKGHRQITAAAKTPPLNRQNGGEERPGLFLLHAGSLHRQLPAAGRQLGRFSIAITS